jgi:glycerol kinase
MENGECTYALEGSIFNAGTAIQWLRDELGFLTSAEQSEKLALAANPKSQVLFVPAFTGMGAPHWNAHARGTIFGLTRDTGRADIVRAALEAVAWQTVDLMEATAEDLGNLPKLLRVDGGMAKNNWFLQFLADVLQLPVQRPKDTETTAFGACLLAGKAAGFWSTSEEIASCWKEDRTFQPSMEPKELRRRRSQWALAVQSVLKIADNLGHMA